MALGNTHHTDHPLYPKSSKRYNALIITNYTPIVSPLGKFELPYNFAVHLGSWLTIIQNSAFKLCQPSHWTISLSDMSKALFAASSFLLSKVSTYGMCNWKIIPYFQLKADCLQLLGLGHQARHNICFRIPGDSSKPSWPF